MFRGGATSHHWSTPTSDTFNVTWHPQWVSAVDILRSGRLSLDAGFTTTAVCRRLHRRFEIATYRAAATVPHSGCRQRWLPTDRTRSALYVTDNRPTSNWCSRGGNISGSSPTRLHERKHTHTEPVLSDDDEHECCLRFCSFLGPCLAGFCRCCLKIFITILCCLCYLLSDARIIDRDYL